MLFLRWIRGIRAIKRRAYVSLRRGISGRWACDALALEIEDRTLDNSLYVGSCLPSYRSAVPLGVPYIIVPLPRAKHIVMKLRYTTFIFGLIALVVVGFLTGCVTLRPATVHVNKDLRAYTHVYVSETQAIYSTSVSHRGDSPTSYSVSVNPRDVLVGIFAKNGFIVLPRLDDRLKSKTLLVSYGKSGRRRVLLGAYAKEITIQLVSAETGELVATATAEGRDSTEAEEIEQAITRALDALFK